MKGFIPMEIIAILIIAFVIGLIWTISLGVFYDVENATAGDVEEKYMNNTENALMGLNSGFALLIIGLFVSTLILGFMIETHPVFFIISFILLLIVVIAAAMLSNSYEEVVSDPYIASNANTFDLITYINENMATLIFIFGIILIIIIYAKGHNSPNNSGGG